MAFSCLPALLRLPIRLLAACTAILAPTIVLAANTGDLDADSRITSADYLLLQQHLASQNQLTPSQLQAADANCDGSVNATDLPALRDLLLERFPPAVKSSSPANLAVASPTNLLDLTFNKRFHDDGNLAAGIRLTEAGPDKHLGTEDDVSISNSISAAPPLLSLSLNSNLPSGTYGLSASPPIADFQGRQMIPFAAKFLIPGDDPLRDSDFDGIPDPEEITNGTHPLLSDSDGDLADDFLERESGTNPLDRWSYPGEAINPTTRSIVIMSPAITYSNFAVGNESVSPDWVTIHSSIVSYGNLPFHSGETSADWVSIHSPVISYANTSFDIGTKPSDWQFVHSPVISYANTSLDVGNKPADWQSVHSPVISYANTSFDVGAKPADWLSIHSPVVSYGNLPANSDSTGAQTGLISIISPTVSYSNLGSEQTNPDQSEIITVASAVISYENS